MLANLSINLIRNHLVIDPGTCIMRLVLLLIMLMALSACGQKGDLYLPDDRTALAVHTQR